MIHTCDHESIDRHVIRLTYSWTLLNEISKNRLNLPLNCRYASDVPEAKDLETALEVGSWAWNWMEPP
jgi:hypothetical protein